MKNLRTILVVCALAGLGACGEAVTPLSPSAPQYDGGVFTAGSGGREPGATQTNTTTSTGTTTADAAVTRGTYTVGSGG